MVSISLPGSRVRLVGQVNQGTADLLADLARSDPSVMGRGEIEMAVVPKVDRWEVVVNGHGIVSCGSPEDIDDAIIRALNQSALETDPDRLHLHAACVQQQGSGIVIAGSSGSGKTTLTLELLRCGYSYLSDEILTLLPNRPTIFGFAKPLTLKSTVALHQGEETPRFSSEGRAAMRASLIAEISAHTRAGLVVFPTFKEGNDTELQRIDSATAAIRLLENSFDAVRLGHGALGAIAQAIDGASCWELEYGDYRDAAETVRVLPTLEGPTLTVVHEFWRTSAPEACTHEVAIFSDGAVLMEYPRGLMAPLSPTEATELGRRAAGLSASDPLERLSKLGVSLPESLATPRAFNPIAVGLPNNPTCPEQPTFSPPVQSKVVGRQSKSADHVALRTETESLLHDLQAEGLQAILVWEPESEAVSNSGETHDIELLVSWDGPAASVSAFRSRSLEPISPRFCFARDLETYKVNLSNGSRIVLTNGLMPTPFSEYLPVGELLTNASATKWNGIWFRALHPMHQFLVACIRVALSPEHSMKDLRRVVKSAPRTWSSIRASRFLGNNLLFHAAVRQAAQLAHAEFGGVPQYFVDPTEDCLPCDYDHLRSCVEFGDTKVTGELAVAVIEARSKHDGQS